MSEESKDEFADAMRIGVSSPIKMRFNPDGTIEILCYQGVYGQSTAIPMVLFFDRSAGGRLAANFNKVISEGIITLEKHEGTSMQ
jgi:hypothetical protein